ncbi:CAP domain-containing protein [Demequina sediminicola]|uniref:CAP domain-containing protein n=1 Tax=Demequina sediminicola TaxID=1095026 RepID=UPI000781BAD3|nr:CAP domain-containing protein [Demequina sediminicola]
MSAPQETTPVETTTRRFPTGVLLLALVPLAVVGTTGAAAGFWSTDDAATSADGATASALHSDASDQGASAQGASVQDSADAAGVEVVVEPVSAADTELASFEQSTPKISVSLPPEPVVTPPPAAPSGNSGGSHGGGSSNGSSGGGSSSGSSGGSAQASTPQSHTAFCSSPSVTASAYSASGFLSAANTERARLGIHPLSWSGSLASVATAWSQDMARRDAQTPGDLIDTMDHNPNRPAGGENVAASYSSAGKSQGSAANQAHKEWIESYGHCVNMMNPAYSYMGAGMAVTSDGNAWFSTVNFQ